MDKLQSDRDGMLSPEEAQYREAYYDFLTGLPNISHFFALAEHGRRRMLQQGRSPAMLFFDLAGMREYNRKFGFAEGDGLLRDLGRLLSRCFGSEHCGRIGSDHFAVFTENDGLENKLTQLFAAFRLARGSAAPPIKAGIYPDGIEEVNAAAACDRAKIAAEKNGVVYSSSYCFFDRAMLHELENCQYLLDNLDRALAENWIRVYYQPIVRTATRRICAEEALARWLDPVRGVFSQEEFIPLLEQTQLAYKLDLHMVEQVIREMKLKEAAGLCVVPVSVNLSRSDFDVCDMAEEIRRRLDEGGVRRDLLAVEITESMIGRDFVYMREQLDRFRALGIAVWMDDFGSGYSTLNCLERFDFDMLKFDLHFMRQYDHSEKSRIILRHLMKMAQDIGIDTLAEGVETEEHVRFLSGIGCDMIQGYYYSVPVPLERILQLHRQKQDVERETPRTA